MRSKVTLVLLFLNVALFFFIFYVERPIRIGSENTEQSMRVLSASEASDIRSLEITRGNPVRTLALAKRAEGWFVTSPLEWPANLPAVSRILTELQFLKADTSWEVSKLAENGQSLADYGLDQPTLTLAITSGDPAEHTQVTRLKIGVPTKDGHSLYALSPNGKLVLVVNQSLARSLAVSAEDLYTDALFTIPVFEARSLSLQTAAPASLRIRLRRDGSRWSFETPIIARASKTATELAINGLNGLRVASFSPSNPPATLPSVNPALKITLEGNNRRETLILGTQVHPDSPTGRDKYYAQLENRSALFTVKIPSAAPNAAPELMDTLRSAQVSLRETRILDFDVPAVTAITLIAPTQPELILQRLETGTQSADNSAWQIVRRGESIVGPQTLPADRASVQRLLDQLSRLTAADFKSDAPTAADLESWGFNRPEREVFLSIGGGATPLSVQFGTDAKHNVFARLGPATNPGSSIYAVDAGILRELPITPLAWRDLLLRELPAGARLTTLKLTDLANNNQVLLDITLDETGHPSTDTKNAAAISAVLTNLRTLRAKEFKLDHFADKVTVAGEERPWRYRLEATATLVGGAGEQTSVTTLMLSARVGGDLQLAGSPEYNAVFSIEQPLLDALWTLTEAPRDPGPPGPSSTPAPTVAPVPAPAPETKKSP